MEIGRKEVAQPSTKGNGIALCCIGRRENRYAREFVAHYHRLGFDKIYLCDNNRDGEERFEDVLSSFIDSGFVEVLDYRNKSGVQREAYEDIYRKYGERWRWMAFFDFDEFLVIPDGEPSETVAIQDLMKNYDGYDCVLFNWMNYGDNGLLRDDGRDLSERFTEPLPFDQEVQYEGIPDDDHVKCMLRGGLPTVEFLLNPHLPSNKLRCCNASCERCLQKPFQKHDFSVAYLKHYCTKTVEEWFLNKWQKGTGNKDCIEAFKCKYAGRFFAYNEWTLEKEQIMRELTGLKPRVVPAHRNVVIVNFNTQRLTECAILSLQKHTPGCRVIVFDNSDRETFVIPEANATGALAFENVEVIDNTNGQIIDFEKVLAEYPDKYPCPENNYGSAKHCLTVDKCFELFPEGFVLMDSDVLVRKDITPFFDDSCAWVGNVDLHRNRWNIPLPRVLPYLCYFNVKMLSENGVRYFNGEKMWFLSRGRPNMLYDTGCWFYEDCDVKNLPANYINISDYILHLHHGSWNSNEGAEWLEVNKELWSL